MDHLPIFVKLTDRPCLVAGGGSVTERKAALLLRAGARVRVVAPQVTPTLAEWARDGRVRIQRRRYSAAALDGAWLVIAATGDDGLNARIAADADAAGILCNVVDDNARSAFILPAIVDRAPLTVAIGTGGRAPVLARQLKARLEAWLPARIGELAARAGRWRAVVRRRVPGIGNRRRFWERVFDGPIAAHVLAGQGTEADALLRRALIAGPVPLRHGSASIVGAGPGDPGLLTLRAQQLIARADVIVHDRLVADAVLDMARKEAECIAVGKSAGRQTMSQAAINALLIARVRQGFNVCRLKGGDPFVFGRGGEEALALAAERLPYEIVPGISAALGCAAYAGVPLTLRGVSGAVTFATCRLERGAAPDWPVLARSGQTLALYMGVGMLGQAAAELRRHGLAADTPAVLVENGTTRSQRVLHTCLATLAADAERESIAAPAMLFVGAAAAHARKLAWFAPAIDGRTAGFRADIAPALPAARCG